MPRRLTILLGQMQRMWTGHAEDAANRATSTSVTARYQLRSTFALRAASRGAASPTTWLLVRHPQVIGAALHAMRYSQNHLSGVSSADALLVHRHRRQRTPAAAVTSPWHRRSISALIAELPRVSGEILPSSASLLAPLTATGRVGSAARTSQAHFGSAASVAAVSHLGHHAESARCERDAVRCAFSPARSRGFQAWPHGGCRVCNADGILHARQERASRQCDCCAPVTWHGVYAHE
mmetsp:Transcript_34708/g.69116  ORF Transcript_34708/g.69116 Transcript_34708/m.69116 type:complete len:237 (+) Transcript_34708:324-1034(+)